MSESTRRPGGKYSASNIEPKWQKYWAKHPQSASPGASLPKKYVLIEFPYPSGDGLHVGHVRPYTAMDAIARQSRLAGRNVLFPIGWDAFGLPTENYAIKTGQHPRAVTNANIATFRRQMKMLGLSFDWSREVDTTDPAYYKWTQWIFLQFYKHGLAYQATQPINWCPKDKIGLANEEVVNGKCERCGTPVTRKMQKQWMLKITAYAERLLKDLDTVDYLEKIKTQQVNWIGKSEGAEIKFQVTRNKEQVTKKKKIILLHGKNTDPNQKWYPWFIREASKLGYQVSIPILPKPDEPILDEWLDVLEKEKPDENTILIGHSRGGVAIARWLEKMPAKKKVDQVIFVATNAGDEKADVGGFYGKSYDFEKIKKHAGKFTVFHSQDDEWVPFEAGEQLAKGLSAEFIAFCDRGHFGKKSPTFPELLNQLNPSFSQSTVTVFTTRPDTIFGATYLVLAPEHSIIQNSKGKVQNWEEVERYIKQAASKSDLDRTDLAKDKTGVELKGLTAINPANNEAVPIWVADYVLGTYGTGAIMAVPAHDFRDFEFANKFTLPIICVIDPGSQKQVNPANVLKFPLKKVESKISGIRTYEVGGYVWDEKKAYKEVLSGDACYIGVGKLINSGEFSGKDSAESIEEINKWLKKRGQGKSAIQYKLRDWVFSRQHYWGEPIPIIHCGKCGAVPVPEKDLPVELPHVEKYQPTDTGESPLANMTKWVNTKCPECGGPARRETDTMPNWAGSSWYYLRYCDPENRKKLADYKKLEYWLPVDIYNGGMEHTVLHLLYSRFWYKFLFDQGLVPFEEPYRHRHSHGLVLAEDGRKMSKSWGNVINPDDVVKQYGADTLRMYEMFMGPFEEAIPWSTQGIVGVYRFLDRVYNVISQIGAEKSQLTDVPGLSTQIHKLVKKVTVDLEKFRFNTVVSSMMEYFNTRDFAAKISSDDLSNGKQVDFEAVGKFLILLFPMAPHIASELWEQLHGGDIQKQPWPEYDEKFLADEQYDLIVQINGKVRGKVNGVQTGLDESGAVAAVLADEKLKGKAAGYKKVVFVPDRLINFIV